MHVGFNMSNNNDTEAKNNKLTGTAIAFAFAIWGQAIFSCSMRCTAHTHQHANPFILLLFICVCFHSARMHKLHRYGLLSCRLQTESSHKFDDFTRLQLKALLTLTSTRTTPDFIWNWAWWLERLNIQGQLFWCAFERAPWTSRQDFFWVSRFQDMCRKIRI